MKNADDLAFERECHERRARERIAWGHFMAIANQQNFERELREKKPGEEREQFIKDCEGKNAQGFWIG